MSPRTRRQPSQEAKLEAACAELRKQDKPNLSVYAATHGLSYQTLRRRYLGLTKPRCKAHAHQQLLSPYQEIVLVDWLQFWSDSATPVSKRMLAQKVLALCGKRPGKNWIQGFLARNPAIKLGKASGLDPKRAQALNKGVVSDYFVQLKSVIEEHGIPVENIYNMDKKGCQRGGGRKCRDEKYFVSRIQRLCYKIQSGNLELVTIIEAVSADGHALKPGFVFAGKEVCPEWYEVNKDIV
jgi:hypothetical protein